LADVIIHEISHSWFGNLVTNANWGEFWLNEGFTMYAQRRISTVLFGKVMSSWHLAPFFSQCPPLGIQATGVCEGRK
jgi:aminopeptidase N